MRVREPRERWILGLGLWGVLFGGVPLVMLVAGGGVGSRPPLFLLLFPVVAAIVLSTGFRRWFASGFTVTSDGLEGAHDAERDVVPWAVIDRFEWRQAGPTSSVRVNDRPLPSGPALFAVLTDGRVLRVTQACAPRSAQRERIHEQLDEAFRRGIVPVHLDRRVDPDRPVDPDPFSGIAEATDVTVTTWSSTGRGTAVPRVGPWSGNPLEFDLGAWLRGRGRSDDDPDDPGKTNDTRASDDPPSWPSG